MPKTPIRAIGIAWYSREDYPRVLDVMDDADKLPRTYDRWRELAEAGEGREKAAGHIVVRAVIEPEEFVAWCRARGLNVDSKARTLFASEVAARGVKQTH